MPTLIVSLSIGLYIAILAKAIWVRPAINLDPHLGRQRVLSEQVISNLAASGNKSNDGGL